MTLAEWDRDAVQAQHVKFRVGRDARVQHVQVTLGGDHDRPVTGAYAGGPPRGQRRDLLPLFLANDGLAGCVGVAGHLDLFVAGGADHGRPGQLRLLGREVVVRRVVGPDEQHRQ